MRVTILQRGKPAEFDLLTGSSDGPWYVGSKPNGIWWYIVNSQTHTSKKIGTVKSRGVNYYDLAVQEAQRRNHDNI
jgi:hypothetical protein